MTTRTHLVAIIAIIAAATLGTFWYADRIDNILPIESMSNVNSCSSIGKMYLNQDNDADGKSDYFLYLNSNFILSWTTNDYTAGQILMTDAWVTYSKVRYYKPLTDMLYKVDVNNTPAALDNSTFYRASRVFPYNTPLRGIATTPNKVVFERPTDNDPTKNIISIIYDYRYKYAVGFNGTSTSSYWYNQIPDMGYMGNSPTYMTTLPWTYGNRKRSRSTDIPTSSSCRNYELHRCGNGIVETSNSSYLNTFTSEQCDGTAWVPSGYTCTNTCTLQAVVVKPTCTLSVSSWSFALWTSIQNSWTISGTYTNSPQITYTPTTRPITWLPYTVTTANGQHTITPTHTGNYALSMTVSNSAWSSVCTSAIAVIPVVPPQNLSCTLTLSPNPSSPNQAVNVAWNVTGGTFYGTYIFVTPSLTWAWPHAINANQYSWSTSALPTQAGTYTFSMIVNNNQSTAACTWVLTVAANPPPTCSLTTITPTIYSWQSAILSGSYTNATSATMTPSIAGLNFIYPTRNNNNISVHPTTTTTYILTVNGLSGTTPAICQKTITVTTVPTPTCSLTTTTPTISSGQTAILNWSYTNASLATITPNIIWLNFIYPNRSNSNISVQPTATTTYTLTTLWLWWSSWVSCTTTVNVTNVGLTLNKTLINNILYHSGDLVGFRIDFANNWTTIANNVVLSDYLPVSLEYVSNQLFGVSPYTFGTWMQWPNQFIEYSWFSLTPGQQWYMILTWRFKWYQYAAQRLNNSFIQATNVPTINSSALFYVYTPSANATITKTADKSSYYLGENARYTIAVTNNGPDTIDNVQIIDTRPNPSCITIDPLRTSSLPMTMTTTNNPYTRNLNSSLSVGQTVNLYLTWHISNASNCVGTYINNADLRYMVNGLLKTGHSDVTINVSTVPTASMSIDKYIITYGNTQWSKVTFGITYQNNWNSPLSNYEIVDYWPGTLTFNSANPTPTTQTPTSWWLLLRWIFPGTIAPNGSGTIILTGTIN